MSENELLSVKNLKKYYYKKDLLNNKIPQVKAVDNISFTIKKNVSLGIIGESGCGKTTLAKCLVGIHAPSSGTIVLDNKTIFDYGDNNKKTNFNIPREKIQMVFQDPFASLNPKMTVGNIVGEGVKIHLNLKNHDLVKYVKEILVKCGLDEEMYNRFPFELSGGQRQRVVIARALAIKPMLLVCDEPTASLDVSIQSQILNLMKDLREEMDITYILITHNINIVEFLCDEIIVMYLGNIVEMGKTTSVCNNPIHPYTKSLISSIPKSSPDEVKESFYLTNNQEIKNCGCILANKCPNINDKCYSEVPKLIEVEENHYVACFMAN